MRWLLVVALAVLALLTLVFGALLLAFAAIDDADLARRSSDDHGDHSGRAA